MGTIFPNTDVSSIHFYSWAESRVRNLQARKRLQSTFVLQAVVNVAWKRRLVLNTVLLTFLTELSARPLNKVIKEKFCLLILNYVLNM